MGDLNPRPHSYIVSYQLHTNPTPTTVEQDLAPSPASPEYQPLRPTSRETHINHSAKGAVLVPEELARLIEQLIAIWAHISPDARQQVCTLVSKAKEAISREAWTSQ